jgi:hypothetical protein
MQESLKAIVDEIRLERRSYQVQHTEEADGRAALEALIAESNTSMTLDEHGLYPVDWKVISHIKKILACAITTVCRFLVGV